MSRLFITGTGTEIGKTWVTAALTRQLLAANVRARAVKPIATGVGLRPDNSDVDDTHRQTDAFELALAMGHEPTNHFLNLANPVTFPDPLSPDMAAERLVRKLTTEELVRLCRVAPGERLLIEGIGGVMVPLNGEETVLDWIAALACPVIVVAGAYLGTLSHTLTTVEVLKARQLQILGVVVSEREPGPVVVEETVASLQAHLDPIPVLAAPRVPRWQDLPDLTGLVPAEWTVAH